MEPLHVLVWGTAKEGPCAYFRGYQYDQPLLEMGIELRHISKLRLDVRRGYCIEESEHKGPRGGACRKKHLTPLEALKRGLVDVDPTDIDWADVFMFRRYYNTTQKCAACGWMSQDTVQSIYHMEANEGHRVHRQDDITRTIWPAFEQRADKGIVYETDDNHFEIKPWNGYYGDVVRERDMIASMVRRADIVTTSTPDLAKSYSRWNGNVRVVRNAIDPELYIPDVERPEGDKQRLVYYGSTARLRDYVGYPNERGKWEGGYAAAAVEEHRRYFRKVFLGTNEGTERIVGRWFDEQTPYIEGIAAFSKALANSHPDVGLAPLMGDDFDRAKSELHWLEYSMAGGATIAQRYPGGPDGGPYNMIRDGVDGILARGRGEWYDAVRRLARNPSLTRDIADAAKERVLAEYDYRKRAAEWADVFRYAAENRGRGLARAA